MEFFVVGRFKIRPRPLPSLQQNMCARNNEIIATLKLTWLNADTGSDSDVINGNVTFLARPSARPDDDAHVLTPGWWKDADLVLVPALTLLT
jgi:hypothetical protein